MENIIEKVVSEYAKNLSLLIIDDDEIALDIYKQVFKDKFYKVDFASNGEEAYGLWTASSQKHDLIITDLIMPNMNGFELINKIRLKSPDQHIIVLSSVTDLTELRSILELGVDGILLKPYNQDKMFSVLSRVLKVIHNHKLLQRQAIQLKLLAKENIKSKVILNEHNLIPKKVDEIANSSIQQKTNDTKEATKHKKNDSVKKVSVNKYNTRAHIRGNNAESFTENLDFFDMDRVEIFQDNIEHYQNIACSIVNFEAQESKEALSEICEGLDALIDLLNHFGTFNVTSNATKELITFIEGLQENELDQLDKKELFVDGLLSLLEDLNNWINMVFIQKDTDNINYFDASFANTCLELESIFKKVELGVEEESIDFF